METRRIGSIVIYDLPPGMLQADDFNRHISHEIKNKRTHLILNLSRVDHIGSAFVSSIMCAMKQLDGTGRVMKLCCLKKRVKDILCVVNLDSMLDIYDSEEDALAGMREHGYDDACAGVSDEDVFE